MSGKRVKQIRKIMKGQVNQIILKHIQEIKRLPFNIRIKIAWGILKGGKI